MVEESAAIRPYQSGDEEIINTLFNRIFKKSRTLQEWKWKFSDNPAGKDIEKWVTVMEVDDRIVGHSACMPVKMKYDNTVITAGQIVDIMLDPSARKNMHLLKLVNSEMASYKEAVSFTFGFPNETAHQIGKRLLGYKDVG